MLNIDSYKNILSVGTKTDATHLYSTCQVPCDVSKSYEQREQTNCVQQR